MFTLTIQEKRIVIILSIILIIGGVLHFLLQRYRLQSFLVDQPSHQIHIPIDLNTATYNQMDDLPGIGPTLAERFMDYRRGNKLSSFNDLKKIKGFSKKVLEKIKPYVYIKPIE